MSVAKDLRPLPAGSGPAPGGNWPGTGPSHSLCELMRRLAVDNGRVSRNKSDDAGERSRKPVATMDCLPILLSITVSTLQFFFFPLFSCRFVR